MKIYYHYPPAHNYVNIPKTITNLQKDLDDLVDKYQEPIRLKKEIRKYLTKIEQNNENSKTD